MGWEPRYFLPLIAFLVTLVHVTGRAIGERAAGRFAAIVVGVWLASVLFLSLLDLAVYPKVLGTDAPHSLHDTGLGISLFAGTHAIVFVPVALVLYGFGAKWSHPARVACAVGVGAVAAMFAPPVLLALACWVTGACG